MGLIGPYFKKANKNHCFFHYFPLLLVQLFSLKLSPNNTLKIQRKYQIFQPNFYKYS